MKNQPAQISYYWVIMLHIHTIPAFNDNYFWLIQPHRQVRDAYIVDPGASKPVFDYLTQHELNLRGVLLTHHHHDHVDGAEELSNYFKVPIYGPKSPRMPQVTHYLYEGDKVALGPITLEVLEIAGHTLDHIAYLINIPGDTPHLFSGDTLFAVGCGRLFDGTAELLHNALKRISALPDNTLIYGGHEYTLSNIRFALTIERGNQDLEAREAVESEKRAKGLPTLPTSLWQEHRTNPFLRCHLNSVRAPVEQICDRYLATDLEVFTNLRRLKDNF